MVPGSGRPVERAVVFGQVADVYHRSRPGYPAEAVEWLVGNTPRRVLDLGAGTGKLTAALVAAGHEVVAVEPSAQMLAILRTNVPDVDAREGRAEAIPVPDADVDAVVVAQAFHWFDHALAVPEIARVLRPGGRLALAWNLRDTTAPWVAELSRVIGSADANLAEVPPPSGLRVPISGYSRWRSSGIPSDFTGTSCWVWSGPGRTWRSALSTSRTRSSPAWRSCSTASPRRVNSSCVTSRTATAEPGTPPRDHMK